MSNEYRVTIALLTHNRRGQGYLKAALEAILGQTYTDFELLVVDNHSTDGTAEFVLGCDDPRLTYVRQPPGGNATTSYIRSAIMARGKYIIMAHDDDVMEPTMIERQVALTEERPDLLVVANNVSLMNGTGARIQDRLYELQHDQVFEIAEYISHYFDEKLWLPAPTLLFKRDVYLRAVTKWLGTKAPAYLASGDIWILFALNLAGPVAMIAEPLLRYRQHGGQESRNVDQGHPMVEAMRLLLKTHGRNTALRPHQPAIHAFLARFMAQEVCFESTSREELSRGLRSVKKQWERAVRPAHRAVDMILPLEIGLTLFGMEPTVVESAFARLMKTEARGGGRRGFRNWLAARAHGKSLFAGRQGVKRVGVLGSMLNAYLLLEGARQAGVEVVAFFDSSPARIGKQVLDVPVLPLDGIRDKAGDLDAVVLSSEHDQEDALKRIVREHLPSNSRLPILSWKELVAQI